MTSTAEPEKTTRSAADSSAEPPAASDVPWYRQLLAVKNTLIIIITPILFLPLVICYPTPVGLQLL